MKYPKGPENMLMVLSDSSVYYLVPWLFYSPLALSD